MKIIEVAPAVPDVLRLFVETEEPSPDFLAKAAGMLAKEKAEQYATVNKFLDGEVVQAGQLLEELGAFQFQLEEERELTPGIVETYHDIKDRVQNQLVELHRSKVKLNDLNIALCRFIVNLEASKKDVSSLRVLDEWLDAASLAEMRLARDLEAAPDATRQQFLSLFTTFRSILCSFDGPSQFLRQLDTAWASLETLHDKVHLESDVVKSAERLEETRKELSTVTLNLASLQTRMRQQAQQAGTLEVKKRPLWLKLSPPLALLLILGVGGYYFLRADSRNMNRKAGGVITQASCREIAGQIAKSPRYQSQVLIFRKFGRDVYFKANASICEKLHRLDSAQVVSLASLLQADYDQGLREAGVFNGHRVLAVKEVGVNTLVVQLANPVGADVQFKLRVLELATLLKAILQSDPSGDALIVSLPAAETAER